MATDLIRYDLLVQEALRGVVRKVLVDTARDGVPGDHHYLISFNTSAPGVRISNHLREKYPQEMTIVLQHQFWDLGITEHTFEVGLAFGGVPERLLIPFDSIVGFFDPSVQFGLKFEVTSESDSSREKSPHDKSPHDRQEKQTGARRPVIAKLEEAGFDHAEKAGGAPALPSTPIKRPQAENGAPRNPSGRKPPLPIKQADQAAEVREEKASADEAGLKQTAEVVSLDAFRKKN